MKSKQQKEQREEELKLKLRLVNKWHNRLRVSGLTQKELAENSGVHQQQITNILKGYTKNPRFETVNKVEKVLDDLGV